MAATIRDHGPRKTVVLHQLDASGPLIDALPFPAIVFDLDLNIVQQNTAHEDMTASDRGEVVGRFMFDAFPMNPDGTGDNTEALIRADVERIRKTQAPGAPIRLRHDLQADDGHYTQRHWELVHSPVIVGGETVSILQTSRDITEAVLRQEMLLARETASQSAAAITSFSYDPVSDAFERSLSVDELFGFAPGEAGDLAAPFFQRLVEEDLPVVHGEVERLMQAPLRTPGKFDYRICIPESGEIRHVRARGEMVIDPEDQRRKLVGVFMDMTDIEATRGALEEALSDKERLLVEMNHRVENSLQMVMSMLRLQATRQADPSVSETLQGAIMRVQAISDVHGALYRGGDATRVKVGELLQGLTEAFQRSMGGDGPSVAYSGNTSDAALPADKAIALGLSVSELMTNAAKYAPSKGDNTISVECRCGGDEARIIVSNPTGSRAADEETRPSNGIGMKLIQGFVKQLAGRFEVAETDSHYRAILTCPTD